MDPASPPFQESLHELKRICSAQKVLPKSWTISDSLPTVGSPVAFGHAREGTLDGSKVRIKPVIVHFEEEVQNVEEVRYRRNRISTLPGANGLQDFLRVAVLWKHSVHPNIVPLLGATTSPLQLVSDWVSGVDLTGYITDHPGVDRLGLVGVPPCRNVRNAYTLPVIRCC